MRTKIVAPALLAAVYLVGCSATADSKPTNTMQKGGMSSAPHEMAAPSGEQEDSDKKKNGSYSMPKAGMNSTEHEMKH